MTIDELLSYEMTSDELQVWNDFMQNLFDEFIELKKKYKLDNIPRYEETIRDWMDYIVPFVGRRGYIAGSGFYLAIESDRGRNARIEYVNKSAEDHRVIMAKSISKAIAHVYSFEEKITLIRKYGHLWKGIESSDYSKDDALIKNIDHSGYIYPLKFDCRKYWYELELLLEKHFIDRSDFIKEITRREQDMNSQFIRKKRKIRWIYNEDKNEFEIVNI